jgi:hypothetical protein
VGIDGGTLAADPNQTDKDLQMKTVAIYQSPYHRAHIVAEALKRGLRQHGYDAAVIDSHYFRKPREDVMFMYGLPPHNREIWRAYRDAGRDCFLIDMGYFGRLHTSRFAGYHRISKNAWHPDGYIEELVNANLPKSRIQSHWQEIAYKKTWLDGDRNEVWVVGMQEKTADLWGYKAGEWEANMLARLRDLTDDPIYYKPKLVRQTSYIPVNGFDHVVTHAGHSSRFLKRPRAIVAHHSNMCVEAVAAGVPHYCEFGAAQPLSFKLEDINRPPQLLGKKRLSFLNAIGYSQYSIKEMKEGILVDCLRQIGLL